MRLGLVEHHQRRLEADGWSGIELVLLLSHLVSAEEPANALNALQLESFNLDPAVETILDEFVALTGYHQARHSGPGRRSHA